MFANCVETRDFKSEKEALCCPARLLDCIVIISSTSDLVVFILFDFSHFSSEVVIDEIQTTRMSTDDSSKKSFGLPNLTGFDIYSLVSNFPKKVCEYVELHFKPIKRDDYSNILQFSERNNEELSTSLLNLEKQMYAWKENPKWVDHPPEIKVTVPKGSLCNLVMQVNVGLPPDKVYNILTDPDSKRVFKNIKEVISRKVLVEEGSRQLLEVEQAALWRFLWWSGTISVHVLVDQNREDHTMKFKQIKSGFMQRFEGCWKMEPLYVDEDLCHPLKPESLKDYISCTKGRGRIGSKLQLEQLIQPSIIPPPPISWYLRGITTKTTETLIHDLLAEADRIRQDPSSRVEGLDLFDGKTGEYGVDGLCDIKERWAMRRKNSRRCQRRLCT